MNIKPLKVTMREVVTSYAVKSDTKMLALVVAFALHAPDCAWGFYNPHIGRWTTRDPIEEEDSPNLYAFVKNNPVGNVDSFGMYTLSDAEDSLTRRNIPKGVKTWYGGRYSDSQLFEEWLALERSRGAWWTSLPQCPSKLCIRKDGTPANPDSTKWKQPTRGGSILRRYHPDGVFEMRSLSVADHGNQCVYDASGNILVGPPSGGTVDWRSPGLSYLWGHGPHDVSTYELAEKLKRIPDYYSVRPSW